MVDLNGLQSVRGLQMNHSATREDLLRRYDMERKLDLLPKVHPWQVKSECLQIFASNVTPKLTVITPFYNQVSTLADCIIGIFRCTTIPFELFLINDASSDASEDVAMNVVAQHVNKSSCCNAYVVRNKVPLYETACDNIGFMLADAEYIVEIQSDIILTEHAYDSKMVHVMKTINLSSVSGRSVHSVALLLGRRLTVNKPLSYLKYRYMRRAYDYFPNEEDGCVNNSECRTIMVTIGETNCRGPWLVKKSDLETLNYLDQSSFFLSNDDHDYNIRHHRLFGSDAGHVHVGFHCDVSKGASRRPRDGINQEVFEYLWKHRVGSFAKPFSIFKNYTRFSPLVRIGLNLQG
jgi:glycosyltransferase involved in cell wall biosynthesis